MIPKIIHYIWLGPKPIPDLVYENNKVIGSDWEVKIWTDKDFTFKECRWVKQAKSLNFYMYCSDALRFYILKNYGGVYLDCDVKLYRTPDNLLCLPYCIGNQIFDGNYCCNSGIVLSEPNNDIINMFWELYEKTRLINNGYYIQDNDTDRLGALLKDKNIKIVSSIEEYKKYVNERICIFNQEGWEIYNPEKDYSFAEHLHKFSWGDIWKGFNTKVKVNYKII